MGEIEKEALRLLLRKARKLLRSARVLFDEGQYEDSISRAYYAMFHAASASLLSLGLKARKHSGVLALFKEHLVDKGLVRPWLHKALSSAFEDRIEADYDPAFEVGSSVAQRRLEEAEEFVAEMERFLKGRGLL